MIPDLIVHCDWGSAPAKRWLTPARLLGGSSYGVAPPERVGSISGLLGNLRGRSPSGPIFLGFDFPIGLPRAYAEKAGITSFPDALLNFGSGVWSEFYHPADTRDQISLARPFYPRVPGGTKKQDLVDGLSLGTAVDLLRRCDQSSVISGVACGIFWTLGANQCGKAAITGWREILAPALRNGEIALWPYHGDLNELFVSKRITVGEVYPAALYPHLGVAYAFGKTTREGRQRQADAILDWCGRHDVALTPRLRSDLVDGFGNDDEGEDKFDSLVGTLGMVEVVQDLPRSCLPVDDPAVLLVEGWMLGLPTELREDQPTSRLAHRPTPAAQPTVVPAAPAGDSLARWCPACGKKLFKRWPWGWDGHAAEKCTGVEGAGPEDRKQVYRERYLTKGR